MADTWTVVSQRETTELVPGQGPRDVVVVYFTTAKGNSGSVKLPVGIYSRDAVAAAIQPYADELDAVSSM